MVTIIAAFALFAGIISTIAMSRVNFGLVKSIGFFILGLAVLLLSIDYFEHNEIKNNALPLFLLSILSISFFLGELSKNSTSFWWSIIPFLLSFSVLLLPSLEKFSYMGFSPDTKVEIVAFAAIASLVPVLTGLIRRIVQKLFYKPLNIEGTEEGSNYLESIISYAFIAIVAVFGKFLLGDLGLLLTGAFLLSAAFVSRNKMKLNYEVFASGAGALFLLSAVLILLKKGGFESMDFLKGEILEGFFFAGFMIIFFDRLLHLAQKNSGKQKVILVVLAIVIPLLIVCGVGFAYTQLERLGGVLALAGILGGMALISIVFTLFRNLNFVALKLGSLGLMLLILPYVKPVERESSMNLKALGIETGKNDKTEKSSSSNKSENKKDKGPEGKDLSQGVGKWKINPENSKIRFALGPEDGRTEGEFKKVKGDFTVKENVEESNINVTLPVESLTTFNSMRDEHLMSSDYFDVEKYPTMSYVSESFQKSGDAYLVSGEFTMLGETNPLEITLKLVGIGERDGKKVMVLWGTSQLDRTEYGMSPSSKIGNVVDFTFEVELTEK